MNCPKCGHLMRMTKIDEGKRVGNRCGWCGYEKDAIRKAAQIDKEKEVEQ